MAAILVVVAALPFIVIVALAPIDLVYALIVAPMLFSASIVAGDAIWRSIQRRQRRQVHRVIGAVPEIRTRRRAF